MRPEYMNPTIVGAFTFIEDMVGEGFCATKNVTDLDQLFLDMAALLGVETAEEARSALADPQSLSPKERRDGE